MSDLLQIFTGNPLSTFIGKKIEAATRPELESEDWALNMEICDIINENDDDAKDAVRAIKKRLQQIEQDRDFTITSRTLTVLETCVSNCSHRFHVLVMTKDFIQDLVKLIGPKNNPPIELQERVLSQIERWAEAFRTQPDLSGVVTVYNDLKAKGVTFPVRDPNSSVPIQTPRRTVLPTSQPDPAPHNVPAPAFAQSNIGTTQMVGDAPSSEILLEGDNYNKIAQDLCVVQSGIDMFNDVLAVLESVDQQGSDWKLAEDLNITCRQMRDRIVDIIERVANEDLTIELLRLNDDLNNNFTKYDGLLSNRPKASQIKARELEHVADQQPNPNTVTAPCATNNAIRPKGVSSRTLNDLALIDFNNSLSTSTTASASAAATTSPTSNTQTTAVDPFDTSGIIAGASDSQDKTRQASGLAADLGNLNLSHGNRVIGSKKGTGLPDELSSVREQDFAEIEDWLTTDSGANLTSLDGTSASVEPISIPNSEFENFIANRALAGGSRGDQASIAAGDSKNSEEKKELDPVSSI